MACKSRSGLTIGLISDTHGLLRPEALRALSGVRQIIHGGDIGGPGILARLREIAPVHAVRGNNDAEAWAADIPLHLELRFEGVGIHVLHDVKELDAQSRSGLAAAGIQVVVAGHSHRPDVTDHDGVLFVNPGSAGTRRFKLPVTVGLLEVSEGTARARILPIL
jgi:putative phosphoesterase